MTKGEDARDRVIMSIGAAIHTVWEVCDVAAGAHWRLGKRPPERIPGSSQLQSILSVPEGFPPYFNIQTHAYNYVIAHRSNSRFISVPLFHATGPLRGLACPSSLPVHAACGAPAPSLSRSLLSLLGVSDRLL
jgi:hypothetical protein